MAKANIRLSNLLNGFTDTFDVTDIPRWLNQVTHYEQDFKFVDVSPTGFKLIGDHYSYELVFYPEEK